MATQHLYRLILIIPAAWQAAFNAWFAANLDPDGGDQTFTTGLNATGVGAPTHYWMNGAFTGAQMKTIMRRLCNLAGVTEPATWDSMTRAQRFQWLRDNKSALTGGGTVIDDLEPMANDGVWAAPNDVLARAGLKRISSPLP